MLFRSPWTLVEANDKNYARVKILRTICERLEKALCVEPSADKAAEKAAEKNTLKSKAKAKEK